MSKFLPFERAFSLSVSLSISFAERVMDLFSFFCSFRAIFYCENPSAARTKSSAHRPRRRSHEADGDMGMGKSPVFPDEGWSSDPQDLPVVSAGTVLGHLMRTGKALNMRDGEALLVQKSLRRGYDFYWSGCT